MTTLHVPARDIPTPTTISEIARAVMNAIPAPEPPTFPALDDKEGWREHVRAMDARAGQLFVATMPTDGVSVETLQIDEVTIYIARPDAASHDDDRVIFEIHGGGLIGMGGDLCRIMTVNAARRSGLVTWGVDYRMPPDHPFPTPLDDCLAAYRALLGQRSASRVMVAGSSAGGNLAAALMVRARDEGVALPVAVHLGTPEIDLTESGDSFHTNYGVDGVLMPLRPVNELYANGEDLRHPYISPLFADLTGLPPTILTTGTRDLFLSNTVLMHRALRRAGCVAELHVIEAGSHGGFFGHAPEDAEIAAEVKTFLTSRCA